MPSCSGRMHLYVGEAACWGGRQDERGRGGEMLDRGMFMGVRKYEAINGRQGDSIKTGCNCISITGGTCTAHTSHFGSLPTLHTLDPTQTGWPPSPHRQ